MRVPCVSCKGKGLCGRPVCPVIARKTAIFRLKQKKIEKDFYGSTPPNIFIGRFNYPNVNVGTLLAPFEHNSRVYDDVNYWLANKLSIEKIADYRFNLLNSRTNVNVRNFQSEKFVNQVQEIAMSSNNLDMEVNLEKKPVFKFTTQPDITPFGGSANVVKAVICDSPIIKNPVQKVFDDTDFKATDALVYLREKNFDEQFLTKLLSAGTLGIKTQRKLVPTRWAITAVDDAIAKNLMDKIKIENTLDKYELFYGGHYGNRFLIILFPRIWSYELFEFYTKGSLWAEKSEQFTHDYEFYQGRKDYAEQCSGGYYAARLPILEYLSKIKKQASALVIREVSNEYWLPLGVWVVRTAVRKALKNKKIFDTEEQALSYSQSLLRINFNAVKRESKLLNEIKVQTSLNRFF